MASHSAYPVAADLEALLLACDIAPEKIALQPLGGAIDSAIEAWQSDTGFAPFLGDGTQTMVRFGAPRSVTLEFGCGFVSIAEVRVDGEIWTEFDDYETRPFGADRRGEPWTELKLLRRCSRPVLVLGELGYNSTLPQRVFDAIVYRAAIEVAPALGASLEKIEAKEGGEIKAKQTGDTRVELTVASAAKLSLNTQPGAWRGLYDEAVAAFKIRLFGL